MEPDLAHDTAQLVEKWDRRYSESPRRGDPALVLRENVHLLPPVGEALDLACGGGANALLLARNGLCATGWDISPVAIQALAEEAQRQGLQIRAEARDLVARPPMPESFDVIVVSHFLDRGLAPALIAALRPGGLLFYQTFVLEAVSSDGPSSSGFRLAENELLALFSPLLIRFYREEGRVGDTARGIRDLAMLVGQRR